MLIRELEKETGLERATIRFYEKEGLITPSRAENGYRSYSAEDCEALLKIKLLRQLGMPLDKIKTLQQGSGDFSSLLDEQIRALEKQIRDSGRAKDVCIEIRNQGTDYRSLNARYYLDELTKPSETGPKWQPHTVPEFHHEVPFHPWKRYFARTMDLLILDLSLYFLLVVILRVRPLNSFVYTMLGFTIVGFLLWIPIEAVLLHFWGTTPGKWIFGIRMESANGRNLSISEAMNRGGSVLLSGYGLTIPILIYWRFYKTYKHYKDQGILPWDQDYDVEVSFDESYNTPGKAMAIIAIVAALILNGLFCLSDSIKPVHRGEDLTIAQIVENHNDFVELITESTLTKYHLNDNGEWLGSQNGDNTAVGGKVVIEFGSKLVGGLSEYVYEVENGFVRSITYEQTWTEVTLFEPAASAPMYTVKAVAFAQDWLTLFNGSAFEQQLNDALRENKGHFQYENLEIIWNIETENCKLWGSYYMTDNDQLKSYLHLKMQIIIHDTN